MPHQVLQSSTQGFYVFADDADAYGEGLSGLSISVSLSKGGGAFNAVSPTITDLGDGVYWVAPLAAHRDTLGEIAWKFAAAGAIIASRFERVVVVNDQVAEWGVPDAVIAAAAATPIRADMRLINGEPPQPLGYDPARQETVEEVLVAVEDVSFGAVVVPLLGQIQSRTEGTTIRVYTQETTTITMAVVNAMGDPVDLDGMALSLVIERAKGGDISVIEDGDIAVNESTISFVIPAEVSAAEGYHNWALRGSDGVVLMQGPLIVEYAPEVDQ